MKYINNNLKVRRNRRCIGVKRRDVITTVKTDEIMMI